MKKFYNIFSKTGRRISAVAFILVAGFLCTDSAFAAGWFTESDFYYDSKLFGASRENAIRMHTGFTSHNAGKVTSLTVTAFHGWLQQNNTDDQHLCESGEFYYGIYNTTTSKWVWSNWKSLSKTYYNWNDWTDGHRNPEFGANDQTLDIAKGLDPGSYQLQAVVRSSGGQQNQSCSESIQSPSGTNYIVSFVVPGFIAYGAGFGSVSITSSSAVSETIDLSSIFGNTQNTINAVIDEEEDEQNFYFVVDETKKTEASVSINNNHTGSITVYFKPTTVGEKTAELTFSMKYGNGDSDYVNIPVTLRGYGIENVPACHIGAEPTFAAERVATVNGYLQTTGCSTISEYGFVWATGNTIPDANTANTWGATSGSKEAGESWSATTTSLNTSTKYNYRAYVKISGNNTKFVSSEYGTFTTGADECIYQLGDTVYFTIDKELPADVPCEFKYRSIETAKNRIKTSTFLESNNLTHNVVFQVVPYKDYNYAGTTQTTITGGKATDLYTTLFDGINSGSNPGKVLIIRSAVANTKPNIQHPTIRNSRNIIFDNVRIVGSSKTGLSGHYDNAMDIDNGSASWDNIASGAFPGASTTADVVIKHCYIWSQGFTCVHVSGYNGVTFEDNDIEAHLPDSELTDANTVYWGSSIKLIQCKNFKFIRNNFRGSHATSLWFQGVRGALLMNNVFWNSNNSYVPEFKNNATSIRLVTQFKNGSDATKSNINENLGIYYNTFYIAVNGSTYKNPETDTRYMDFLRLGSKYTYDVPNSNDDITLDENLELNGNRNGTGSGKTVSSIAFKYNNCYSYDEDFVLGSNAGSTYDAGNKWCITDTESNWCDAVDFNNFWSMRDEKLGNSSSVFEFPIGCSGTSYFINVKELVCTTEAEDPGSLVLKGGDLNLGPELTSATDKSGLGAYLLFNDRLHPSNGNDAVRQVNGRWTLGAYQQSEGKDPISTIVWWGGTKGAETDWDNRNNWRKEDGSRVTCVDNIAEDVKIIIPAPTDSKYKLPDGGIEYYPVVPNKFAGDRTKLTAESVNAGQGILAKPNKFAGTIELEYGGVLKNVQSLKDNGGDRRYSEASNHLVVRRSEWILVGTVIKPFDEDNPGQVRLVESRDYYLYHTPHVYMHEAKLSDRTIDWDVPFADLDKKVDYDKVFAIKVPNQYGYYKVKDNIYYKYEAPDDSKLNDGSQAKTFDFNGWFLNDEVYPEYKVTGNMLLCNTLPANIDIAKARVVNSGAYRVFDYTLLKNFGDEVTTGTIKSQNGFAYFPDYTPGDNSYFRITNDMLENTSTIYYKGAEVGNPYYKIMALNSNGDGGSLAVICLDELKDDVYVKGADVQNVVSISATTQPEIYIERYGLELDKLTLPNFDNVIPLTLSVPSKMTVDFGTYDMQDIETAILEDRGTGMQYDLLNGEKGGITLAAGLYQGRFYLNLGAKSEEFTTIVDDGITEDPYEIDIYSNDKEVVITSSGKVALSDAYITDMSGRTTKVSLKDAHYNVLTLDGLQGVYIIKAVGDNMSRTEKVIVK